MFSISKIEAGWFNVVLDNRIMITNSNYMDNDAPKILLRNVAELFNTKRTIRWLCWQDEPEAYIWRLELKGSRINIRILDGGNESYNLEYEGQSLDVFEEAEIYFEETVDFYKFAKEIYTEFKKYSCNQLLEEYEREWMDFAHKEFEELKKCLREYK